MTTNLLYVHCVLCRVENFKENTEPAISHKIIKPLQFSGEVTRSLSSWYKAVPAVDVQANLQMLEVGRASSMYHIAGYFRGYKISQKVSKDFQKNISRF